MGWGEGFWLSCMLDKKYKTFRTMSSPTSYGASRCHIKVNLDICSLHRIKETLDYKLCLELIVWPLSEQIPFSDNGHLLNLPLLIENVACGTETFMIAPSLLCDKSVLNLILTKWLCLHLVFLGGERIMGHGRIPCVRDLTEDWMAAEIANSATFSLLLS